MSNNLDLEVEILTLFKLFLFPNYLSHVCNQVSSYYLKPSMSNQNIDQSHGVLKSSPSGFCSFFLGLKCHKSIINQQLSWMFKKKKASLIEKD